MASPAIRPRDQAGLLVVAALSGVLMVAIAAWSHLGVVSQSEVLRRGEGQLMLDAVMLSAGGDVPSEAGLVSVMDALQDKGLVWAAVVRPDGNVLYEVGRAIGPPDRLPSPVDEYISFGSTARMTAPPKRRPGEPPPRAHLVIEYIPQSAVDLERRSRRALAAAIAGAVLLFGAALWLFSIARQAALQEQQLTEHRHLAALGQMSAVMAHEIKNPLAALKGHAQLLARAVPQTERERAERVVGEAQRLEGLVHSLLDFARTASLERQQVDPKALLEQALEEVAGDRVVVYSEGAPASWSLDPVRIRQVLVNLLDNALKATKEAVRATVTEEDGELVFRVRDHGAGIPDDVIDQVFEPFFTTRTKGSGLGLAVVRRITTLHGGTVSVRNHPEGGAELTVRIPST